MNLVTIPFCRERPGSSACAASFFAISLLEAHEQHSPVTLLKQRPLRGHQVGLASCIPLSFAPCASRPTTMRKRGVYLSASQRLFLL